MTNKKSDGGEGTGSSPISRKPKAATPQKRIRTSSPNTGKRRGTVQKGQPIAEHSIPTSEVLHGDIAKRAYELYERRGWHHGQDISDWLVAEQEILTQPSLVGSSRSEI